MMKNLLLILCFFPMLALAQEEDQSKYMVGAVPEVNGKVVFSQEINAPNLSKDQIFDAILAWANTRFKTDKGNWGMVAYSNKEEGQIILTPGQRAELNKSNGRLTVKQVDAKLDAVWHDNLIPFQKADIFTITKALERFYDVKIILSPDIRADKTYSGVLRRKSTIDSVLTSLQNSIPIDYKIVGSNIFISPK